MTYRKLNFDELSKVSGGWSLSSQVNELVRDIVNSLNKWAQSCYAGYHDSPFH
ncbi:hypothetical protein LMC00_07625 [Limosilactobacillus reuteri]|uniref:hypothetical protein n=1 Tax=Limosilactobacillus reuteri TaxID=1598 RepID=UPI00155AFF97|nr:hypothetical protein [Limosilactobacillus reuteri]MBU5283950.1 hypothetical protein [Limosilactobacillus reuteri]MCC4358329.1 hypothetical protein [Limosilactobacillus reuteri]MCC4361468.1 hypothetical protein [Limosilactobacillus reuteri]MCC4364210.1 hypothetical protein [Limosilactobacillus reuteri]MCC4395809.1 hypothetical protein [Limosilactobacillus reuteri]